MQEDQCPTFFFVFSITCCANKGDKQRKNKKERKAAEAATIRTKTVDTNKNDGYTVDQKDKFWAQNCSLSSSLQNLLFEEVKQKM